MFTHGECWGLYADFWSAHLIAFILVLFTKNGILTFLFFVITIISMITFDETKRQLNLVKHGIDFIGCGEIFKHPTITREDMRGNYSETRLQTLGIFNGLLVFVVHTPRQNSDHIISIRKANKNEEKY